MKQNPYATLTLVKRDGQIEGIKVLAPVHKQSLRLSEVTRVGEPELFSQLLIRQIADAKSWAHDFPPALEPRLIELGLLITDEQLAKPVSFDCDLTPALFDEVPIRHRSLFLEQNFSDLIVNPTLQYLGTSDSFVVDPQRAFLGERLRKDRFWYLVSSPDQYAPRLYSCNEEQHDILRGMSPGKSVTITLDSNLLRLLTASEILVNDRQFATACSEAKTKHDIANRELETNRYTVFSSILHPFQSAAIRRYYSDLVEQGYLRFGDEEWPLRFFTANDPIAFFYLEQLQPIICRLTGETVRPTFFYLASYRPGAVLPAHRDRDDCEFSISLLLDFVPEPEDLNPWPIFVEVPSKPDEPIPIYLGIGDMLLYRGIELKHYRYAFKEGKASTTWLFFYVPVDSQEAESS